MSAEGNAATRSDACPKCGCADLYVVYHKQSCNRPNCRCTGECGWVSHAKEHREHLHVSCRRCSFDWVAPTLGQLQAMAEAVA